MKWNDKRREESDNLEISVNQPVRLKVVVIFSKRVDQLLCNLKEKKHFGSEIWKKKIQVNIILFHEFKVNQKTNLEPPGIKEKLQKGEDGHVEVKVMAWVTLIRI